MKTLPTLLIAALLSFAIFSACSSGEEERQQQEQERQQAIQDSLEMAHEEQMEQMRRDSIEKAQESEEQEPEEDRAEREITYTDTGEYSLQIEAWRSREKAESRTNRWKEAGFEHVYIIEHGDSETGNLWYRIRMGNFETRDHAEAMMNRLADEHQTQSWVATGSRP